MALLGQSLLVNLVGRNSVFKIAYRFRRATPRRAVETFKNEVEYNEHLERQKEKGKKNIKARRPEQKVVKIEDDEEFNMYNNIPKDILELKYEKPNTAKIGNFSKIMLNMKSRAYRERHGSCLLEGKFLIADAMKSGMFVRLLYFSRLKNLVGLPIDVLRKTNLIKVDFREIQLASELPNHFLLGNFTECIANLLQVQSEGLIAVATKQDEITRQKLQKWRANLTKESNETVLPLTLICDNIRDAGNMGALLRTAAAAGCQQVITTQGSVDIWDPKVIRAGAGAHFKIPILPSLSWNEIKAKMDDFDVRNVYLTLPQSKRLKIDDILPNYTSKNDLHNTLIPDSGVKLDDMDEDISKRMREVTMHPLPYYDALFVEDGHTVLVLGSEVLGTNPEAYLYSIENALRNNPKIKELHNILNIPMAFESECLNTAVAGSILLYDAKRQLTDQ